VGPPELACTGGPIEPPVIHGPEPGQLPLFPVDLMRSLPQLPAVIEAAFSGPPRFEREVRAQADGGTVATQRSRKAAPSGTMTWPFALPRKPFNSA